MLARYTDRRSRAHRVVLRRDLVLDLSAGEPPRLVAMLGEGEGELQARALLDGSAIDEGYLARARREPRPFIRALRTEDLRPPESARQDIDQVAAEEPPLAA